MKSPILPFLLVFLAAMLVGYLGEVATAEKPTVLTRGQLLETMGQVLETIQPFLQPDATTEEPSPFTDFSRISPQAARVLKLQLMRGFSDGRFCPDLPITRGETVEGFGRLLQHIRRTFLRPPEIREFPPLFLDVPQNHWLQASLAKLAGIGAFTGFTTPYFQPDAFMNTQDAQRIGAQMIQYLTQDLIVARITSTHVEVLAKGTLSPLPPSEWNYAWEDGIFRPLPLNGAIPFPKGQSGGDHRLLLSHPLYHLVELPSLVPEKQILWFLLLRPHKQGNQRPIAAKPAAEALEPPLVRAGPSPKVDSKVQVAPLPLVDEAPPAVALSSESRPFSPSYPSSGFAKTTLYSESRFQAAETQVPPADPLGFLKAVTDGGQEIRLEGRVHHINTKKPIAGATVLAGTQHLVTNQDGYFSFAATHDQLVDITVYCEGFESLFIKHRVGFKPGPVILPLKEVQAMLEGKIEDGETGLPISGAMVQMGESQTVTDEEGRFQITHLPPTYHQLSCQAAGYMNTMEIIFLQAPKTERTIRLFTLPPDAMAQATE